MVNKEAGRNGKKLRQLLQVVRPVEKRKQVKGKDVMVDE